MTRMKTRRRRDGILMTMRERHTGMDERVGAPRCCWQRSRILRCVVVVDQRGWYCMLMRRIERERRGEAERNNDLLVRTIGIGMMMMWSLVMVLERWI